MAKPDQEPITPEEFQIIGPEQLGPTQPSENPTAVEQAVYEMSFKAGRRLWENMELTAQNKKLSYESAHDPLTGLLNRRGLEEKAVELELWSRQTGTPVAVIVCDLDKYKEVNDRFGHPEGDKVLVSITGHLRHQKTADVIARLGGDEFVILAPLAARGNVPMPTEKRAEVVVNRLETAIQSVRENDGRLMQVEGFGATFGCKIFDPVQNPESKLEDMLPGADQAMYAAKQSKKNNSTDSALR